MNRILTRTIELHDGAQQQIGGDGQQPHGTRLHRRALIMQVESHKYPNATQHVDDIDQPRLRGIVLGHGNHLADAQHNQQREHQQIHDR